MDGRPRARACYGDFFGAGEYGSCWRATLFHGENMVGLTTGFTHFPLALMRSPGDSLSTGVGSITDRVISSSRCRVPDRINYFNNK
jgi:hypothetical protein